MSASPATNQNAVSSSLPREHFRRLLEAGLYQEALALLQPLVSQNPMDPELLDAVATTYFQLENYERGIEILQAMAVTWPENAAIWGNLGARSLQVGDKETAKAAFERKLALEPKSASTLSSLDMLEPFERDSSRTRKLRYLSKSGKLSTSEQVIALNTLGKIEERSGRYKAAIRYFSRSKATTPGTYDSAATDRFVADQVRVYYPEKQERVMPNDAHTRLSFIVGMPRSGTTLLETMLTAHSEVGTIGESPALLQTLGAVQQRLFGRPDPTEDPWAWLGQAPHDLLLAARETYYQKISPGLRSGFPLLLDKLPQNQFELGFAHCILPEAKFIAMQRHPLDVGLSLFSNSFHQGHHYTHKLEWIGHRIRASHASLLDYSEKLEGRLRLQSYRQLVEDPEAQLRSILSHLNLDWETSCLSPEDNTKAVTTASINQVRKSINRSGLNKWKPYEAELKPLIEALGGWDWIHMWEEQDAARALT